MIRSVRAWGLRAFALACLVGGLSVSPVAAQDAAKAGAFDFYVLSLSWSPTYCLEAGQRANKRQCGGGKHYGFIVHGLWPQTDKGYPESCASTYPPRVPQELGETYFDIMPSISLIGHEWRTHGTCSGLDQKAYFDLVRKARESVKVPALFEKQTPDGMAPAEIETAFLEANPGLPKTAVAVTCDQSRLQEVRICMTRDLKFRSCSEVDAKSCALPRALVPPVR